MDKETEMLLDTIATKAATDAVAKMREFHQDDLKALRERMDMGFESVDRRFDVIEQRLTAVEDRMDSLETRFDRVENALSVLLEEFKQHQEKQRAMEAEITRLTKRVRELEQQLAAR